MAVVTADRKLDRTAQERARRLARRGTGTVVLRVTLPKPVAF